MEGEVIHSGSILERPTMLTQMTDDDWTVVLEVFAASCSRRGDKGYDSRSNRQAARSRGICPAIPYKSTAKNRPAFFPKTL